MFPKNKKWLFATVGIEFAVGYTIGFLTYFFGTLFTVGKFSTVWMPVVGWIIVLASAAIFTVAILKKRQELKQKSKKIEVDV